MGFASSSGAGVIRPLSVDSRIVGPIYFDYNATTPLDSAVSRAMQPYWNEIWGNPSSVHQIGRRARSCLDEARDRVATFFRAKPSEIIFTSGGTESNNLAIFGTARLLRSKGKHIITSPVEHHAVLHCFDYLERYEGFKVTRLPVDSDGVVDIDSVKAALTPETTFVSVMAANNETGVLQPVAEIGALCRSRGIIFHTDASQWFGKMPFQNIGEFNADLVTLCAHKFHGPRGAGVLYMRSPLLIHPILFGGGHENERRAGTENLPAIVGMTEAIELFIREPVFAPAQLSQWTGELSAFIAGLEGVELRGSGAARLSNTVSFTVQGADSIALMAALDLDGVCASSGSACSAGSLEPSHVLTAMGVPRHLANSFARFSLGRETTEEEVKAVQKILPGVLERFRRS